MQFSKLGSTGLSVSKAGLGCGGNSRLGLGTGHSENEAVDLVLEAHDLGVNFFDTAAAYGTERVVGRAVARLGRDRCVISSKTLIRHERVPKNSSAVQVDLESSLRRLNSDYIDVFSLHAVTEQDYDHALGTIYPVLARAREEGKIRHIGITESAPRDPAQKMLRKVIASADPWEVAMFAYSMLNHGSGDEVASGLRARGSGTLLMFAVRNLFSRSEALFEAIADLVRKEVLPVEIDPAAPFAFLSVGGPRANVIDAAYRFARWESGADVVLFGTGNNKHLRENVSSILAPPLPEKDVSNIRTLFGHLVGVGLDLPDRVARRHENSE